jgi:hypothetical protein
MPNFLQMSPTMRTQRQESLLEIFVQFFASIDQIQLKDTFCQS